MVLYIGMVRLSSAKYDGRNGPFMNAEFAKLVPTVNEDLQHDFLAALNCSKSDRTWVQFNSVLKGVEKMASEADLDLSLPWCVSKMLNYVLLLSRKGLKVSSIKVYLSKVRQAHVFLGHTWPQSVWLNMTLKGLTTLSASSKPRLAMTPDRMRQLKLKLKEYKVPLIKKRIIWMASCFAFAGCMRAAEYLPDYQNSFEPSHTLLGGDISMKSVQVDNEWVRVILLRVKEPKEKKQCGSETIIELFESFNFCCPITAYIKWREMQVELDESKPLFMYQDKGYTRCHFNSDLKKILSDVIDYSNERILSHSFRSGMATTLARAGYPVEDIQLMGRWSSDAYAAYVKSGRAARFATVRDISRKVTELSKNWSSETILV